MSYEKNTVFAALEEEKTYLKKEENSGNTHRMIAEIICGCLITSAFYISIFSLFLFSKIF